MASTNDIHRSRMKLRDDLIFIPQSWRDRCFYHVECKAFGTFYRIGYAEYVFLSLLDGDTTFAEALALSAQSLGAKALTTQQAMSTYMWVLEKKLGSIGMAGATSNEGDPKAAPFNPFWVRIPLGNPHRLLRALLPCFGWIFSAPATLLGMILIAAAGAAIFQNWERFILASGVVFDRTNWLWMGVAWIVLKVVHEMAHGLAARRAGVNVREVGAVFILLAPLAYVDVTSAWRLPSRWTRIQIAAAGMYVELVVAALATFLWLNATSGWLEHLLFNLIVMASVSSIAFNANPLMRFDGYFILSDLFGIPNLYEEGSKAVRGHCCRLFLGRASSQPTHLGNEGRLVAVYGWLSMAWRVLICVSLAIAASVMFKGAGVILSVLGVVSWYGVPAVRMLTSLAREAKLRPSTMFRCLTVSTAIVASVVCLLFFAGAPVGVSAPGIIEYEDVVHVRNRTEGFAQKPLVHDGEVVEQDQLLLVLDNDEVSNMYRGLLLSIEQTKLKLRIALEAHETATAKVERRNLQSLEEQLVEARRRYEGLEIRAPQAGKVVARELISIEGTYAAEGTALLSIGREAEKESIISVSEHDFDTVIPMVGEKVRIVTGPLTSFTGKLIRLEPRASTDVPNDALAATEGGPLAVEEGEDSNGEPRLSLTEPRFRGVVSIPNGSATQLHTGQRCRAICGFRRQRLGVWLWTCVHDWIESKLGVGQGMHQL